MSSRENDEIIMKMQGESLYNFAQELKNAIALGTGRPVALDGNELAYTLTLDTADSFSLTVFGSDTDNADCFEAIITLDGCSDYFSCGKDSAEAFKAKLSELVCALAGNTVTVSEILKSHSERVFEYSIKDGEGWKTVLCEKKLGGFGAALLIWKSKRTDRVFDLRYK